MAVGPRPRPCRPASRGLAERRFGARRRPASGAAVPPVALAELRAFGDDLGDQFLGLAAGRAVADRHDAHLVLAHHVLEDRPWPRTGGSGGMRVDHRLVEQLAAGVEHGDLAAVLEPGIDRQDDLLGDRRLEQQAAQVAGEDLDGVLLGGLGQVATDLALHAGQDQPVEGIDGGGVEQVVLGMALQRELAEQRGLHVGPGHLELDLQRAFLVAAVDRQHAVGRDLRDRLGVFEVIAVFQALALGDLAPCR